ncbi:hypothetical protein [Erythrobacter sp.]|jgi:type IV secretory pathway protease TraF|uniref:hypothetical protein n=1 Tax=Erythrobacter sp. TaxID=1042 RepID=UPI002EA122DA|nr:hypothetical protein [Erythrobacter sp.]
MTTNRGIRTALSAIALTMGGAAMVSANESQSALTLPASEFVPMQRYAVTYEEPVEMAKFYVRQLDLPVREAQFEEGRSPYIPNHKVVIATVDGIENPTVKAIQWRIELKADGNAWEAVAAGLRRMCQNGPNTDTWTTDTCP